VKAGDLVASKYRLRKRLGQGGMGAVWAAEHTQTGRDFAIKFLHPLVAASSEDARRRFLQEARASARVNHANIIDILDVGETEDGSLYLVMELLEGLSLQDALRAEPRFNVRELLLVIADVATALGAAHAAGVIHRDIKPPNIYLHRDRATGFVRTKVLDFGVSKVHADAEGVATHTGSLLGSPRYMAPEQAISAAAADGRSDIWSVGVVMYEALTGTFPHEGDSSNSLVIAIATKPPRPITDAAPQLPEALRQLVDDCLKPPNERFQKAQGLVERIKQVLEAHDMAEIPLARPPNARTTVVRPDSFIITSTTAMTASFAAAVGRASMPQISPQPQSPPRPAGHRTTERMTAPRERPPFPPLAPMSSEDATLVMQPRPEPPENAPPLEAAPIEEPSTGSSRTQDGTERRPSFSEMKSSDVTIPIPASAAAQAPPAPPDPIVPAVVEAPADPSESISSINVVRGDGRWVPPPSFPPMRSGPSNRAVGIAIVAVGLVGLLAIVGIVVTATDSPDAPAAASASSEPASRLGAPPLTVPVPVIPVVTATATASASSVPAASASASAKPKVQGPMPRPPPTGEDLLKGPGF
jgi:serine/threonine-protein kinase